MFVLYRHMKNSVLVAETLTESEWTWKHCDCFWETWKLEGKKNFILQTSLLTHKVNNNNNNKKKSPTSFFFVSLCGSPGLTKRWTRVYWQSKDWVWTDHQGAAVQPSSLVFSSCFSLLLCCSLQHCSTELLNNLRMRKKPLCIISSFT